MFIVYCTNIFHVCVDTGHLCVHTVYSNSKSIVQIKLNCENIHCLLYMHFPMSVQTLAICVCRLYIQIKKVLYNIFCLANNCTAYKNKFHCLYKTMYKVHYFLFFTKKLQNFKLKCLSRHWQFILLYFSEHLSMSVQTLAICMSTLHIQIQNVL